MSSRESRAVARGSSHRRDRSRDLQPDLSRENTDELRIVLLGRTGAGKSATGNTILGRKAFKAELSFTSVTKDCRKESSEVNGRLVTVIDTPGLYNTELTNEEIQREISNCISMILPGPHVFIIVNSVGRFTQEDETLAKIIQEMFGEKSLRYAMVLFTGGDYQKNRTIEEYLGGKPRLMELIEACGNRYHVFNNKDTRDRTQVSDLLEKIDIMSEANGGSFYLMFKQMDREGLEQQTEILMDRARERGEKMRKLQDEKERMKMSMEEERQNHDKQRREELMEKDEEMRREQETFVNEIELLKQEKEKLQFKYDTDIERLEKEKKRREEEFNEKEERHQRDIKKIHEEMKREREEWEKRRLEEKTRREEEKEKQTPATGPTNRFSGAEGEADDLEQLRIVLIGRTGSGKSATGNSILGRDEFVSQLSMSAVTTVCQKRVGEVDGRAVAVVDTPGLFDMTLSNDQVIENLMKCVSASAPGPHVFVIVLSLGRFDREEANTVDLIKKIFGPKTAHFSIVLFTGGDELGNESVEDYVKRNNSAELEKLIGDCGNRFLVFNNKEKRDRTQVIRLFHMIEELKHTNDSQYLTNSMFERAEMAIKKRTKEIMNEKEREIEAQYEAINGKYEMEMKNMMKRLEEEKRRADEERMKTQTQLREKEEKLRKEFEEKEKREQMKRENENQKRSEEEKQRRDEYHKNTEELKREIENLRLQNEKQQKEREEEDRKREEKNRRDLEKMIIDHERVIAELQMKHEEEIKKRDLEEKRRNEEEEEERWGWTRKIKEAENDRKEIQEEMKRQQREWEDERKRQMREREEEERKRREKHEEQLREKQEELEKMRKRFEREREEERQKIEEERQKQRREREEKEREFEEKIHDMKRLERESAEEWERRKREDDERREEERKRWMERIEDVKREQEEEIKRREREEQERKEREEKERNEMNKKREEEIKVMKKKHEEEARSRAELREFREEQHIQELQQMLEERHKHHELLEKLYRNLQEQRDEEIKELVQEIKKLKKNKSCCAIM